MKSLKPLARTTLALLVGCGSSHNVSSAVPDATVVGTDAHFVGDGGPSYLVRVLDGSAPSALVAYRDETEAGWQTPTTTPDGYEFRVKGSYVVSVTCVEPVDGGATSYHTTQTAQGLADPAQLTTDCVDLNLHPAPPPSVEVRGTMVQPGTVSLGTHNVTSSTFANWDFDVQVPPATIDVLATTADRFLLRRNVTISTAAGATTLPAIDVTTGGTLVSTPAVLTNVASNETASVIVNFETSQLNGIVYDGALDTAVTVPASAAAATDYQQFYFSTLHAQGGTIDESRTALRRWAPGDSTEFSLPDLVPATTFTTSATGLVETFATLPTAYDSISIGLFTVSNSIVLHATSAYVQGVAGAPLAIETDIPGFQAAWRIDATATAHSVSVASHNGDTAMRTEAPHP